MDDEQQLIRRVLHRESEAEEDFVRRYRGLVLGLARGRFGLAESAAEEIFQSTMEKLWNEDCRALRAWRGKGKFSSYLTVIVTHICLRRRERKAKRSEDSLDSALLRADIVASAMDGALLEKEKRRLVNEVFRALSARDRLLIALRYGDGRSPREISVVVSQAPGTVRKALHDALNRMRARLQERCPEHFDVPVRS